MSESTQDPVDLKLIVAAIDVIDADGAAMLTVRSLAVRCNYSASTVAYHTGPFRGFLDRVWRAVGSDLALAVFADGQVSDRARRLVRWTEEFGRRAEFFVLHVSEPPARTNTEFWSFLSGVRAGDERNPEMIQVLHLLSRRLQATVDFALRCPPDQLREPVLAYDLASVRDLWRIGRSALAESESLS